VNPKKIAFVSTMGGSPWGGSELLWSDAAAHLLREGHAVAANVAGWAAPARQIVALREAGVDVLERRRPLSHPVSGSIRRFAGRLLDPFRTRSDRSAFNRWLACQRPDLTCISSGWIQDDLGLMRLCRLSGRAYALIIHANAEQWWPADGSARALIDIYQGARRVFFVAERNRQMLETQLGIALEHTEVVRNPISISRDAAPGWPAAAEPVRLACIGRLEPMAKGQDLLLQVLAAEPWRSRKVEVSFFGRGDAEEGLRRLAKRLELEPRVHFCGQVDDIEGVWASHHMLVLPSRYEGLPLVTVEAMICGRPVIVTDVAGNNEIVQDGLTGFVAEAPSVRHLRLAMERAWENRCRWEAMGQAAAKAARQFLPNDPGAVLAHKLLELAGRAGD
jgi:glycosyltransferase involved in cell wall biosynthesis